MDNNERFARQIMIGSVGAQGQKKIANSHVVVVGAGGLGCPVLTYLASAGVGKISIIDCDLITLSNLNRQTLYSDAEIDKNKGAIAAKKIREQYPNTMVKAICKRLEEHNVKELLGEADVIVDCVDSIATRLVVNDYAVQSGVPLIEGGIDGFYGFLLPVSRNSACIRCVGYSENTQQKEVFSAIGATAGVIGSLQASAAIQIILGNKKIFGRMVQFDATDMSFDEVSVNISDDCAMHK